jgi:acyl-coenzyme A synthetase/AMP-(fatty) acid ligase
MAAPSPRTVQLGNAVTVLDLLEYNLTAHPTRPALRLARPNCPQNDLQWVEITYTQFYADIQSIAKYWHSVLFSTDTGMPAPAQGDTVTLWLPGIAYIDILHQLSLLSLGYTVQMISHQPMAQQVVQLVTDTSSKVLIAHPAFLSHEDAAQLRLPIPYFHPPTSLADISDIRKTMNGGGDNDLHDIHAPGRDMPAPPPRPYPGIMTTARNRKGSDVAFILHTSGTTSGRPKCIPITHDWIIYATKNFTIEDADDNDDDTYTTNNGVGGRRGEIVRSWLGNIAHVGTLISEWCLFLLSCLFSEDHSRSLLPTQFIIM